MKMWSRLVYGRRLGTKIGVVVASGKESCMCRQIGSSTETGMVLNTSSLHAMSRLWSFFLMIFLLRYDSLFNSPRTGAYCVSSPRSLWNASFP